MYSASQKSFPQNPALLQHRCAVNAQLRSPLPPALGTTGLSSPMTTSHAPSLDFQSRLRTGSTLVVHRLLGCPAWAAAPCVVGWPDEVVHMRMRGSLARCSKQEKGFRV